MAADFSVRGTIELCPPVPHAQLWEPAERGLFTVAPHGLTEPELTSLVACAHWVLVPDADSGTDAQGRPVAISHLRVHVVSEQSPQINYRLQELSAWMGAAHEFAGGLRFEGEEEAGTIEPFEDGELPLWHDNSGRSW
ncbi:hypothetical protein ACFYWP_37115 [Actinacidiphila glaucinigra]|uniref:hypothetical protein n=1 Tax=Actinacidiphila glaucinigra TaxID=235986 RepID=UPI00369292B0